MCDVSTANGLAFYADQPRRIDKKIETKLEKRISRLERIVKKGLDFEHPEILDEIKEL